MATPESDQSAVVLGGLFDDPLSDGFALDEQDTDRNDVPSSIHDVPSQQEALEPLPLRGPDEQPVESDADNVEASSAADLTHSQLEHDRSSSTSPKKPGSVQYQVDEQIHQEASMSDSSEHVGSSQMESKDVTYVGMRTAPPRQDVSDGHAGSLNAHRTPQPYTPKQVDAFGTSTDTSDLLEVVAFKFNQQQQNIRNACSAENKKLQRDLQSALADNQELRSHVEVVEDQCNRSADMISKYKTQIVKAKGLQKFLDGLGSDLRSLKDSFDTEKGRFKARVKTDEMKISRLESALTGRNEYERILSNSKASLERLLEGKGFELHAVVQHRDMLRLQLDEKIGQLAEERDSRSRLQQLVSELRNNERTSFAIAIEQCTQSLASKLDDVSQKGDGVALSVDRIHKNIQTLSEKPSSSPDEYKAIEARLSEFQRTIVQTMSIGEGTDTTLADLSAAVGGILEHHTAALRSEHDHIAATAKLDAAVGRQEALQTELEKAWAHARHLESQLAVSKQTEASLNDTLAKSNAQVESLSAAADSAVQPPGPDITISVDVESKINEAVAKEQKRLSENANAFVAQEKARFSNEIKRSESERNKTVQKAKAQGEVLSRCRIELEETQAQLKVSQAELQRHTRNDTQQQRDVEELSRSRAELSEAQTQLQGLQKELRQQEELALEKQARIEELSRVRVELDEIEAQRNNLQDELRQREQQVDEQQAHVEDFSRLRIELDEIRVQHESLQLELRRRDQQDAEQRSQIKPMKDSISNLREQCETSQATIEKHEASEKKLQLKENDSLTRANARKRAIEGLQGDVEDMRLQLDVAQTAIAGHRSQEKQRQLDEHEHKARESVLTSTIDGLRKDYSEARVQIASLKDDCDRSQQSWQTYEGKVSATEIPDSQPLQPVQPPLSEPLVQKKQLRKADRSNNTIVTMPEEQAKVVSRDEYRISRPQVIVPPPVSIASGTSQSGVLRMESHPEKSLSRIYSVGATPDLPEDNDMLDFVPSQAIPEAVSRACSNVSEKVIPDSSHGSRGTRTPLGPLNTNGSSPEFMNMARNNVKRRYSGSHTLSNAQQHARRSATPLRDPRDVAKIKGEKRSAPANHGLPLQDPPTKKQAVAANTRAATKAAESSVISRSSQSVSDLSRIEDMNRNASVAQSSRMRSSADQARTTQTHARGAKGKAYQDRFSQELRRR